jgi:hypothetical protein
MARKKNNKKKNRFKSKKLEGTALQKRKFYYFSW